MADIQQHIQAVLTVSDQASGPLGRVAAAAGGMQSAFGGISDALTGMIPLAGGVATALSFHGVMQTTENYIKQLKEVRELTGAAGAETDYLFSSARQAGVEYGQMQGIMFRLSRRASMLTEQMQQMGGRVTGVAKRMQSMGVDMTKGPVHAMVTLSEAVKKGRVGASELMSQFQIPMGAVNDFKGFLEQLDENELKAALESGKYVSDADIDAFDKMEAAQHRIADAFNRIQVMLGKTLIPVVADLTDKTAKKIEEWLPAARRFGQYLADNFDKLLATAKAIMAVFAARKVVSIVMATPVLGTAVSKLGTEVGARIMTSMAMGMAGGAGPLGAVMGTLSAALSTAASAASAFLLPVLAIGAALYAAYAAIQANVGGIKDYFGGLITSIATRFSLLFDKLGQLWDWVSELGGGPGMSGFIEKLGAVLVYTSPLTYALGFLGETIDFMMHVVLTAAGYIEDVWSMVEEDVGSIVNAWTYLFQEIGSWADETFGALGKWMTDIYNKVAGFIGLEEKLAAVSDTLRKNEAIDLWARNWERTQKATEQRARLDAANAARAKRATDRGEDDKAKAKGQNFDFRGSRFDITQNFAEGFDPDRIAVAFASDLAGLAETKSQSNFAPLYSVR